MNAMEESAPAARAALVRSALLAAAAALVYGLSYDARSDGVILGNDVITYALALAPAADELPNAASHLGYHWLCRGAYELLHGLGGAPGALLALRAQQLVSVAAGALAMFVVARFAVRRVGPALGVPIALALAASSGVWIYAAIGDSVVPGLALAAGAWSAALDLAREPARRPWALCAWIVAAAVVRQDAVLCVPAFALLLPARTWMRVVAVSGAATFAVYALAWWRSPTEASFARWLLGTGADGSWNAGLGVFASLARTLWSALLAGVGAAEHAPLRALPVAALLVAVLALAGRPRAAARRALLACAVGAAARLVFFGWFQAINVEYQIATLVPVAFAVIVWLEASARQPSGLRSRGVLACAWLLAASVAAASWRYEIQPHRGSGLAERARIAVDAAGVGGVVLTLDPPTSLAVLRELYGVARPEVARPQLAAIDGGGSAAIPERSVRLAKRIDAAHASGKTAVVAFDLALRDSYRLAIGSMRADPQRVEQIVRRGPAQVLASLDGVPVSWLLPAAPR